MHLEELKKSWVRFHGPWGSLGMRSESSVTQNPGHSGSGSILNGSPWDHPGGIPHHQRTAIKIAHVVINPCPPITYKSNTSMSVDEILNVSPPCQSKYRPNFIIFKYIIIMIHKGLPQGHHHLDFEVGGFIFWSRQLILIQIKRQFITTVQQSTCSQLRSWK